jgi:hypothetical protein
MKSITIALWVFGRDIVRQGGSVIWGDPLGVYMLLIRERGKKTEERAGVWGESHLQSSTID